MGQQGRLRGVGLGLFAISNFALGVLLARWVCPVWQLCRRTILFPAVATLHSGLFSEPMLVFGSARHGSRFPAYFDILLHAHWRVTGLASVLFACVALICWLFASLPLASAFLGAAVANSFILFGWLVRRACFSRLQPQWAAAGGAVYLLLLDLDTYLLSLLNLLSAFTAFVLLGGSA